MMLLKGKFVKYAFWSPAFPAFLFGLRISALFNGLEIYKSVAVG